MNQKEAIATKPPADVIEELKAFAAQSSIPMDEIKSTFYTILVEPYLDDFEIEDRCRQASKILLAQIASKFAKKLGQFEFKVIDRTAVKMVIKDVEQEDPNTHQMVKVKQTTHLAKIYGLFGGAGDDSEKYPTKIGIVTVWNEACQSMAQFIPGKTYAGAFQCEEYESFYSLTMNDPQTCPQTDTEIGNIKDIITNFFTPIPISQAQYNLGEARGDYKLIIGRVRASRISLNKKGNNMGWLDLIDENMGIEDIKDQDSMKISCMFLDAPEFATRYGIGSLVYVLCDLSNDGGEFGLSAFGQMVIPILGIPNIAELGATPTPGAPPIPATPTPANSPTPPTTPIQQPATPTQGESEGNGSIPQSPPIQETPKAEPNVAPAVPEPAATQGW